MEKTLKKTIGLALVLLMTALAFVSSAPVEIFAATVTFGLNNGNSTGNQSSNILNVMRFLNNAGTGT